MVARTSATAGGAREEGRRTWTRARARTRTPTWRARAHTRTLGQVLRTLLLEDECEAEERALAHKVDRVEDERLEERDGVGHARAGAGDADGQRGAVAHVRVVRLGELRDERGHLAAGAAEDEAEAEDGGAAHVVGDVGDGDVQQAAHGGVAARAGVRQRQRKHAAVAQHGVLVAGELADEAVGGGLLAEAQQRQRHADAADGLFVRRVVRLREHFGGGRARLPLA